MPKCAVSGKAVYPLDRQINLDGKIILQKYAKCADCNGQITLSNFHISDAGEGKVLLLCKTHYLSRFKETGVYVGADKFKKKAGAEVVAASAASAAKDVKATPRKTIKSTIWSPTGPSQANDATYELERNVTTPDRRPSLRASLGGGGKGTDPKDDAPKGVDLLAERRASLKSVESKANTEISEEARRSSITRPNLAEMASANASAESTEAVSAAPATAPVEEAAPATAPVEEAAPATAAVEEAAPAAAETVAPAAAETVAPAAAETVAPAAAEGS